MLQTKITGETTVYEVISSVPEAIELFRQHGVNPAASCGPLMSHIQLKDTPHRCRLADLDELLDKLNDALVEN